MSAVEAKPEDPNKGDEITAIREVIGIISFHCQALNKTLEAVR